MANADDQKTSTDHRSGASTCYPPIGAEPREGYYWHRGADAEEWGLVNACEGNQGEFVFFVMQHSFAVPLSFDEGHWVEIDEPGS